MKEYTTDLEELTGAAKAGEWGLVDEILYDHEVDRCQRCDCTGIVDHVNDPYDIEDEYETGPICCPDCDGTGYIC